MAPVTDTGTADDRGGKSPARASAGRWPRDDRGSPGCRVAEVDASKSRRAPPTGSSPPQPNHALPESATLRRLTPLGSAIAGRPSSDRSRRPGARGCRQQSGVRTKYGTGRWVNWQAGKQIPGVLNSAHLATHSKLEATYARLSRSSPKRPLGRINPQTTKGAPRACGGGPVSERAERVQAMCSPRVWGWAYPSRCDAVVSQMASGAGDPSFSQARPTPTPPMCRSMHTSTLTGTSAGTPS